jgi:hypothetical protein
VVLSAGSDAEGGEVVWVGAVGEFGEVDAKDTAEGGEVVGADSVAVGFDVVYGGAGPVRGLCGLAVPRDFAVVEVDRLI